MSGRSRRAKLGLTRVEGPQAVAELLRYAPGAVEDVFVARGVDGPVVEQARACTRFVHEIDASAARALGPAHQGIVATASLDALGARGTNLGDFLRLRCGFGGAGVPLLVVLAGTQDPGNTGTMVRLADAMGASGVIQTAGGADLWGPKVLRAAAGSSFHIPLLQGVELASLASHLKGLGVALLAAHGRGGVSLPQLGDRLARPLAWVFGNEARGLGQAQLALADECVAIPMPGRAESLNVAAAAAITLYQTALARDAAGIRA